MFGRAGIEQLYQLYHFCAHRNKNENRVEDEHGCKIPSHNPFQVTVKCGEQQFPEDEIGQWRHGSNENNGRIYLSGSIDWVESNFESLEALENL